MIAGSKRRQFNVTDNVNSIPVPVVKKRKSRWGGPCSNKSEIPGMPSIIPQGLNELQEKAYVLQLQIENISLKLREEDYGIPDRLEDRSPSPEPIYGHNGQRLNTREYRIKKSLEEERHKCIEEMKSVNPIYRPPADYRPPLTRLYDRVPIPQNDHSGVNFVGLLIGPRGNTLKQLEKETNAKIMIRGKGSVKEGKLNRSDGQTMPGEDEPLHAMCYGNTIEIVANACKKIREIIDHAIEKPDSENELRKMQLRELAIINGTYRGEDVQKCNNCGAEGHKSWQCTERDNIVSRIICRRCGGVGHVDRDCIVDISDLPPVYSSVDKAKMDSEYLSLMSELGQDLPRDKVKTSSDVKSSFSDVRHTFGSQNKESYGQIRGGSGFNTGSENKTSSQTNPYDRQCGGMPSSVPRMVPPPTFHQSQLFNQYRAQTSHNMRGSGSFVNQPPPPGTMDNYNMYPGYNVPHPMLPMQPTMYGNYGHYPQRYTSNYNYQCRPPSSSNGTPPVELGVPPPPPPPS